MGCASSVDGGGASVSCGGSIGFSVDFLANSTALSERTDFFCCWTGCSPDSFRELSSRFESTFPASSECVLLECVLLVGGGSSAGLALSIDAQISDGDSVAANVFFL
eukprot:TRINITY_DN6799_c0_g1_i1.p1 TRINITY_DN6799_c0_g1~~TRINITY_DN6799_c0_g1_i1.p1  ORF type:complete len:107 (-),score=17.09 TRINITY_DN6799_c0_g1_i1:68-388(-)